jgi:hypothetical protein
MAQIKGSAGSQFSFCEAGLVLAELGRIHQPLSRDLPLIDFSDPTNCKKKWVLVSPAVEFANCGADRDGRLEKDREACARRRRSDTTSNCDYELSDVAKCWRSAADRFELLANLSAPLHGNRGTFIFSLFSSKCA